MIQNTSKCVGIVFSEYLWRIFSLCTVNIRQNGYPFWVHFVSERAKKPILSNTHFPATRCNTFLRKPSFGSSKKSHFMRCKFGLLWTKTNTPNTKQTNSRLTSVREKAKQAVSPSLAVSWKIVFEEHRSAILHRCSPDVLEMLFFFLFWFSRKEVQEWVIWQNGTCFFVSGRIRTKIGTNQVE